MRIKLRVSRVLVVVALAVGSLVAAGPPANALQQWVCDGAGTLVATTSGNRVDYRLDGTARCSNGDSRGPYIATFAGTGTANAVGGCSSGLPLLITGLRLDVNMVAQSVTLPSFTRSERMSWQLLASTYPNVTPFLVYQNQTGTGPGSSLRGAGNIASTSRACEGDRDSSGVLFDLTFLDKLL